MTILNLWCWKASLSMSTTTPPHPRRAHKERNSTLCIMEGQGTLDNIFSEIFMVVRKLCSIASKFTPLLLFDSRIWLHIFSVLKEISEFTAQPTEICGLHSWVFSFREKLALLRHLGQSGWGGPQGPPLLIWTMFSKCPRSLALYISPHSCSTCFSDKPEKWGPYFWMRVEGQGGVILSMGMNLALFSCQWSLGHWRQ